MQFDWKRFFKTLWVISFVGMLLFFIGAGWVAFLAIWDTTEKTGKFIWTSGLMLCIAIVFLIIALYADSESKNNRY